MRSTQNITDHMTPALAHLPNQLISPENPLTFLVPCPGLRHHPHQQKDSWNCVVRLLCYLSQQQQNQGQNKLTNNVMAVITYLDNIIVIVNRT